MQTHAHSCQQVHQIKLSKSVKASTVHVYVILGLFSSSVWSYMNKTLARHNLASGMKYALHNDVMSTSKQDQTDTIVITAWPLTMCLTEDP